MARAGTVTRTGNMGDNRMRAQCKRLKKQIARLRINEMHVPLELVEEMQMMCGEA